MTREEIITILQALGVKNLTLRLEGGGDSGTCEIEEVEWHEKSNNGNPVVKLDLDKIPHPNGTLGSVICDEAADWPEGDWYNGPGGQGTIEIQPGESEDPWDCISISMSYNDEDYNYDEDEDEDEDELDSEENLIPSNQTINAAEQSLTSGSLEVVDDIENSSQRRI